MPLKWITFLLLAAPVKKTLLCAIAYVKNGSSIRGRENKWDRKSTWVSFYSATLKKAIGLFCVTAKKRGVKNVASHCPTSDLRQFAS